MEAVSRLLKNSAAMNSLLFQLIFLVCFIRVHGEDSLVISHAPNSIKFDSVEPLKSSDVADIFSAMFSYTVDKDVNFQSLSPVNPFARPEAMWIYDIHKAPGMELNINGQQFPLENYGSLWNQYYTLKERTNQRYSMYQKQTSSKPVLVKINPGEELYAEVSETEVLKNIPQTPDSRLELALKDPEIKQVLADKTFNTSMDADNDLLIDIGTVKLILNALKKHKNSLQDDVPDIFWVELRSLTSIAHRYGADSYQSQEACRLIEKLISDTILTMNDVYHGNDVVSVFIQTPMPEISRNARSLLADPTPEPDIGLQLNLAYQFDSNFSVAFALVAFTSIVLILTVLGVSVAMWFLDPGRDSIIYRMTSQRMKKD